MPELLLYNRPVATVFDLLGQKENDITYSIGWGLARSTTFLRSLLRDLINAEDAGEVAAIRLQQHEYDGGFTDIEIEAARGRIILEARRGWELPTSRQLMKYAVRLPRLIVSLSAASSAFADLYLPTVVSHIPVTHRSWSHVAELAAACNVRRPAERLVLADLVKYLKNLRSVQDQRSNLVFVVALSDKTSDVPGLNSRQLLLQRDWYVHPFGVGGGWPTEPPNYLGFRWNGLLKEVRHVEEAHVVRDLREVLPDADPVRAIDHPRVAYRLGPPIRPATEVRTGRLYRAARVWAMIDLLLTCDTISEARDLTNERFAAAQV